jgi:hypothetical protein
MNFSHSANEMLSDAASKLKSLAREMRFPQLRGVASRRAQERLNELASALDQFVASTTQSLRSMREATAPYLAHASESAGRQAELLRDNLSANVDAVSRQLAKRRGLIRRHPFIVAATIAGTGYFAVRALLNGTGSAAAASAGTRRSPPARAKSTRAPARKSARPARPTAARARNARTRRNQPAATTPPATAQTPNAVH